MRGPGVLPAFPPLPVLSGAQAPNPSTCLFQDPAAPPFPASSVPFPASACCSALDRAVLLWDSKQGEREVLSPAPLPGPMPLPVVMVTKDALPPGGRLALPGAALSPLCGPTGMRCALPQPPDGPPLLSSSRWPSVPGGPCQPLGVCPSIINELPQFLAAPPPKLDGPLLPLPSWSARPGPGRAGHAAQHRLPWG